MFGTKKEKALEEELASVKEQSDRRQKAIWGICGQKDDVLEQFARLTASRAQMEKDMQQVARHMQRSAELAESSSKTACDVHNTMMEVNNTTESFDANHTIFVKQINKQNDTVKEIVEKNKHFTTPMKYILELPASMKEDKKAMHQNMEEMMEFSKQMGVLALGAAIEAGRMGESGKDFIKKAEEIRAYSENYEKATAKLLEQFNTSNERMSGLEEQVTHLNELLKDNNISMGRLLQEGMKNTISYESGQLALRGLLPDEIVKRADALQQSQQEASHIQERMLLQMNDIRDEFKEQMDCSDELERIYKHLHQTAEQEL